MIKFNNTILKKQDKRLSAAIARGKQVYLQLQAAEGGSLSTKEVATKLGISQTTILRRYRQEQIFAWHEGQNLRFPAWQFHKNQVLVGIKEVLHLFNTDQRLDDAGRLLFFLSNLGFLEGKRPLDYLRDGKPSKVLMAAQGYIE